jgi:uncharacterized membrane protein YphA (DoxX/SURF4 family)
MIRENARPSEGRSLAVAALVARLVLGGLYIYMGLSKALHPVDFLKLVRQYEMIDHPFLLNLVAAGLPWFEVLCGLLLVSGIAVRGTAVLSLLMLLPFTALVLNRALAIQAAKGVSFCAVRFDCGCGAGEVFICHKLIENGVLLLASALLLATRAAPWCLRYHLVKPRWLTNQPSPAPRSPRPS